jgi:hypothetical protein
MSDHRAGVRWRSNLTATERTYWHNDPGGAYPTNTFFSRLIPFLSKVGAQKS